MADVTHTDAAYAAGLFDGEGCVELYMKESSPLLKVSHSFHTALSVTGVDLRPLEWLQACYKGTIKIESGASRSDEKHIRRSLGRWMVFSVEAEGFANSILPYVKVKREQLELWLEARKLVLPRGGHNKRGFGLTEDEVNFRRELVTRTKELKRLG